MAQFTELWDTMEHVAKRSAENRQRLFSTLNILQRKNIVVTAELLIQILKWKESGKWWMTAFRYKMIPYLFM